MKKSRLMDLVNAAAVTLGLCVISSQATAAVICDGASGIATSCSGVVYNSTTYDVTWALPNYTGSSTTIFDSEPTAQAASDAALTVIGDINTALTSGAFTNIQYQTSGGPSSLPVCVDPTETPGSCTLNEPPLFLCFL